MLCEKYLRLFVLALRGIRKHHCGNSNSNGIVFPISGVVYLMFTTKIVMRRSHIEYIGAYNSIPRTIYIANRTQIDIRLLVILRSVEVR